MPQDRPTSSTGYHHSNASHTNLLGTTTSRSFQDQNIFCTDFQSSDLDFSLPFDEGFLGPEDWLQQTGSLDFNNHFWEPPPIDNPSNEQLHNTSLEPFSMGISVQPTSEPYSSPEYLKPTSNDNAAEYNSYQSLLPLFKHYSISEPNII